MVCMGGKPQTAARKVRVMVVDDEPLVSKGVALLLGVERGVVFCGEAESEAEALHRIQALKPDVVLVDLVLKKGTGLSLTRLLRRRHPKLKVLVMSTYDEADYVTGAFAAGAHGYIAKDEASERLLEALDMVMSGGFYLSEKMAARTPSLLPGSVLRDARRRA